MATLDSTLMPPQFSIDNGVTWLTMVCMTDWTLNGDTPVDIVDTFCGPKTGYGTPGYREGSGTIVAESAPSAAQVSVALAQTWWFLKTALKFRVTNPTPAGTVLYIYGDAVIKSFNPKWAKGLFAIDLAWGIDNTDITP